MNTNAFLAGMFGSLTILDAVLLFYARNPWLFLTGCVVVVVGGLLTFHFIEEAGL